MKQFLNPIKSFHTNIWTIPIKLLHIYMYKIQIHKMNWENKISQQYDSQEHLRISTLPQSTLFYSYTALNSPGKKFSTVRYGCIYVCVVVWVFANSTYTQFSTDLCHGWIWNNSTLLILCTPVLILQVFSGMSFTLFIFFLPYPS